TPASPYIGATSCLLPFGTIIQTNSHSFYTVQAGDVALPRARLTDTATLDWNNTCTAPNVQNCTTGAQTAQAGSSTQINQLTSSTATDIHNAQHQVVTGVRAGTTVHDFVTVTGQPNQPAPTGNVTVDWFTNNTCTGNPVQNSGPVGPLVAGAGSSTFDATGFTFTPAAGAFAFRAHYLGDAVYSASNGGYEPLQVVDARIHITPDDTNEVSVAHTFTVLLEKNLGAGWVPANGEHV